MKKIFNRSLVVLVIFICMVVIFMPTLFCSAYENVCTESEADIIFKMESNKINLQPGEEFTLTYTLEKLPNNGLGVAAADCRLIYDSTQLEFISSEEGPVSQKFSMSSAPYESSIDEFENSRQVIWYGASGGSTDVRDPGMISTITFRVKDNVSGPLKLYVRKENGFSGGGIKINDEGEMVTDSYVKNYLKSNLDKIRVSTIGYSKGDINRDKKINMIDVYYGMKGMSKGTLIDEEIQLGDVTSDGKFNMTDVNKLLRYIAGKITTLV